MRYLSFAVPLPAQSFMECAYIKDTLFWLIQFQINKYVTIQGNLIKCARLFKVTNVYVIVVAQTINNNLLLSAQGYSATATSVFRKLDCSHPFAFALMHIALVVIRTQCNVSPSPSFYIPQVAARPGCLSSMSPVCYVIIGSGIGIYPTYRPKKKYKSREPLRKL